MRSTAHGITSPNVSTADKGRSETWSEMDKESENFRDFVSSARTAGEISLPVNKRSLDAKKLAHLNAMTQLPPCPSFQSDRVPSTVDYRRAIAVSRIIRSIWGYSISAKLAMKASLPSFAHAGLGFTSINFNCPSAPVRKSKRA